MIKYILLIIVGLIVDFYENINTQTSGHNFGIGFFICTFGGYAFLVCLWFKFLRSFYPKATISRLWGVTGYILWIIIVVILCFTGIGAISLATIKHPIKGLVPREEDK